MVTVNGGLQSMGGGGILDISSSAESLHRWLRSYVGWEKEEETRVCFLGLDGAGKTTLLRRLAARSSAGVATTNPTAGGCDVEDMMMRVNGMEFTAAVDVRACIGGQQALGRLSRDAPVALHHHLVNADAVVYVVDSCDRGRLSEAVQGLRCVFDELARAVEKGEMRHPHGMPAVLVLANKQDQALWLDQDQRRGRAMPTRLHHHDDSSSGPAMAPDLIEHVVKNVLRDFRPPSAPPPGLSAHHPPSSSSSSSSSQLSEDASGSARRASDTAATVTSSAAGHSRAQGASLSVEKKPLRWKVFPASFTATDWDATGGAAAFEWLAHEVQEQRGGIKRSSAGGGECQSSSSSWAVGLPKISKVVGQALDATLGAAYGALGTCCACGPGLSSLAYRHAAVHATGKK